MKEIKGEFFNGLMIIFIIINFIMFYALLIRGVAILPFLIIELLMNIIMYYRAQASMHYFQYDEEKIIVKNLLNPAMLREIEFSKINMIEVKNVFGKVVCVETSLNKYAFGVAGISSEELNEMVDFVNECKKSPASPSVPE